MGMRHATRWRLSQRRPPTARGRRLRARADAAPDAQRAAGARSSCAPGTSSAATSCSASLAAHGYRREHRVEHRGEVAVRGGIVDVWGSTADVPVRIDLYGDEVERLCTFDPGDQRQSATCDEVWLFACRELVLDDEDRERAASARGDRALGRGALLAARRRRALRRDGGVAHLARAGRADHRVARRRRPRRRRSIRRAPTDRAAELARRGGRRSSRCWRGTGARPRRPPPLHVAARRRPRAARRATAVRLVSVPEDPATPVSPVRPAPPLHGDPARLAAVARDAAEGHDGGRLRADAASPRRTSPASSPARASRHSSPTRVVPRRGVRRRRRRSLRAARPSRRASSSGPTPTSPVGARSTARRDRGRGRSRGSSTTSSSARSSCTATTASRGSAA